MKKNHFNELIGGIAAPAATILKSEGAAVTEDALTQHIQKTVDAVLKGEKAITDGVEPIEIKLTKANEIDMPDMISAAVEKAFADFRAEQETDNFMEAALKKKAESDRVDGIKKSDPSGRAEYRNRGDSTDDEALIAKAIEVMPVSKYAQRGPDQFSLMRLTKALSTGNWEQSRIEKALTGQLDESGGYTVPDVITDELITFLREKVIVMAAGARVQPMTSSTLGIPVLTSGTSYFWRGTENTSLQESATPKFGLAKLIAKEITGLLPIPNELLDDSSLNMERIMIQDLSDNLAEGQDIAWLVGQGVDEPVGITNFPGVTTVSNLALASLALDTMRNLLHQVRLQKSKATAIITHPTVTNALHGLEDANGRPLLTQDMQNADVFRFLGVPIHDSINCIDSDGNYPLIAAPMSEIRIGERGAIEIDASREIGFKENVTWLRAIQRVDLTIGRPETVVVQTITA